jgi:hypothetical protein
MVFAAEFGTGQVLWSMFWFFLFFIWIWLLIVVFSDIFRTTHCRRDRRPMAARPQMLINRRLRALTARRARGDTRKRDLPEPSGHLAPPEDDHSNPPTDQTRASVLRRNGGGCRSCRDRRRWWHRFRWCCPGLRLVPLRPRLVPPRLRSLWLPLCSSSLFAQTTGGATELVRSRGVGRFDEGEGKRCDADDHVGTPPQLGWCHGQGPARVSRGSSLNHALVR